MDFQTLHRNFGSLISELNELVLKSAMELKSNMADLNVKQLEKGIGTDDKKLEPSYQNLEYAKAKKSMGSIAPLMTPDLKLTGSFHSGIEAIKKGEAILMWSTDEKTPKLDKKYPKSLGLNKSSKTEMKPELLEKLLKNSRTILHKE